MANVTPGIVWTSTTPLTAANLNLGAQPTVTLASGEVGASNGSPSGIGYATGAGGSVTQSTNKSTGVTLNKICGQITMNNANLASGATVGFTLTNSFIAANDVVIVNIKSGATADDYVASIDAVASGSCRIQLYNHSGGALAEAVVLNFAVIKAVAA